MGAVDFYKPDPYASDRDLAEKAAVQTAKTKAMIDALSQITDQNTIPKTNPWITNSIPGDASKFASPQQLMPPQPSIPSSGGSIIPKTNPWDTTVTPGDSGKFASPQQLNMPPPPDWRNFPTAQMRMPGPYQSMNDVHQAIPPVAQDMFQTMKEGVTTGGINPGTGEYNPKVGLLAPEIMLPSVGRALKGAEGTNELAAFMSSVKKGKVGPGSNWTLEMSARLKALDEAYKGVPNQNKTIINNFREMHPEYPGTDATILNRLYKTRILGGANIAEGAASTKNMGPGSNEGGSFELGAFGGRGRLRGDNQAAEGMDYLQKNRPVDEQWVKDWAKDANVPIARRKMVSTPEGDTTYIDLKTDNPPPKYSTYPRVRIPNDMDRHIAVKPSGENLIDTGTGLTFPKSGEPVKIGPHMEPRLMNEAGMSYSNPAALDARLKYETQKAPFGGNWLIPEDMKPRLPSAPKTKSIPETNITDPRQLKLLSQGYTPLDILNILRQQQNGNQ